MHIPLEYLLEIVHRCCSCVVDRWSVVRHVTLLRSGEIRHSSPGQPTIWSHTEPHIWTQWYCNSASNGPVDRGVLLAGVGGDVSRLLSGVLNSDFWKSGVNSGPSTGLLPESGTTRDDSGEVD